jgi:hypothetical protein
MITIFCDFRQFSSKQLEFFPKTYVMIKILHNLPLFWVKSVIFLMQKNISKIITSVRVTSLGEFSPNGWLFTCGSFV